MINTHRNAKHLNANDDTKFGAMHQIQVIINL